MIFQDGKSKVSRCRYVDKYHTEVAGQVYHHHRVCRAYGGRGGIACAPEEPLPRQTDKQAPSPERRHLPLTREEATRNLRF